MAKHKGEIIAAAVIAVILAAAWFMGGGFGGPQQTTDPPTSTIESYALPQQTEEAATKQGVDETTVSEPEQAQPSSSPKETASPPPYESATPKASESPKQEINQATGKDEYQTEPVLEDKPSPVEPQDVTASNTAYTCTLSVRCDTILNNIGKLDKEKVELVPEDGVIFKTTTVTFYEGESVFNVLQREMKRAKIHMSFRNTPIYNSAYIEAINNLYEFDRGDLSGWMYKVNDWFPNYGCSRYQLKHGDVVEWLYTCDLGRDIGGGYATGGQAE